MTRILVVEKDPSRFAAFQALAATMGYDAIHADGPRRLVLEIRAAPAQVIVASVDMSSGNGLDLVRDAYRELDEPLPVVACSQESVPADILRRSPCNLLLVAIVAPDPSPERVLQAVLNVVGPADPEAAQAALSERSRDSRPVDTVRLEGKIELGSGGAAKLLVAVERQQWGGSLRYQPVDPTSTSIACHFVDGMLAGIRSVEGGDLIASARVQGRLEGIVLPEVTLSSEDEEVGLLMAMRALGPHEVEQLKAASQNRLIGMLLSAEQGSVSFESGSSAAAGSPRRAVLPLLLAHRRESGGDHAAAPLAGSPLRISLPSSSASRGLSGLDRDLVQQLSAAANRTPTVGSFVEEFARSDDKRRTHAGNTLVPLRQLGYVDYAEALFPADVSDRLGEMVTELHRWSRSNHFDVLGVDKEATDRVVRDKMRKLSLLYHPDRLVDAHSRVKQLAEHMYSRVQEVFSALETAEARSEYRGGLRSEDSNENATRTDQSSAKVAMAQASILVRQKRYGDAASLYRDATLHDPGNAEAHMWLGWCSYLGDRSTITDAVAALQKAGELNSRIVDAVFYLGRIQLLEKNYKEAKSYFQQAVEAPAGHPQAARELRLMESRGLGLSPSEETERTAEAAARSGAKGLFSRFRRG